MYTEVYFRETTQNLILILLHVSATNRSHLQGATAFEGVRRHVPFVGALKPNIVQFVGNKRVCTRELHGKRIMLNKHG